MLKKLLLILMIFVSARTVVAQTASDAIVTGTVIDFTNRAVTNASISVTNIATGVVTKTTTNNDGQYRTPPLQSGEYKLDIDSPDYKHFSETGIVLDIGSVRQINASLSLGQVSDAIEVQATTEELLQKSDSTVGTVLTTQQIEELPLNGGSTGRDYLQLATLSAGTTSASQGVSIGGQAGTQAAFLLDGIDNNNQEILTSHSGQKEIIKPSVDAISEFKVVTTSYSAEYGRSSSGVVSVNIKSGTNQIHGSAYEFIRNDAVDALPYLTTTAKLPYKYNDFGATLGGPIRRDHTFVFGDIELFRYRTESQSYSLVPTDEQRSGQFASAIYVPSSYTGAKTPRTSLYPLLPAFAFGSFSPASGSLTYQIPAASIDPIAKNLLQYYPESNLANSPVPNTNYTYLANAGTNNYRWDVRLDDALTSKQSFFGRFSSEQIRGLLTSSLPPLNGQYYAGSGSNYDNSQAFVIGYNITLSPNLLASARAGWNKIFWNQGFPDQPLTGVGIPGVPAIYPGFSQIAITNYTTIGISNTPNSDDSQDREIAADITWNHGAHTLQLGWQEYWLQTNFNSSQQTSGIFTFNGQYTAVNPTATPSLDQKFGDFLLGAASSRKFSDQSILNFRSPYTHFFAQDDWKVSHTLTLNLGLRYELSPPVVSKFNSIANFDEDSNPNSPQLIYAGEFGNKRDQRALQNLSYTNLAPRIGFAYSPENSKTVLRGGYGIFYSNAITIGGMQSMENNPPVNQLTLLTSPSPNVPSEFLHNGFAPGALSLTKYTGTAVTLVSFDRHAVIPIDQQWNLNIQHALPYGIVTEIGYVGNKFDHNWWQVDGNPASPAATLTSAGVNANRRYTTTTVPESSTTINIGTVSRVWKEGWSQYNGLQAKAEKRFSKGVSFLAAYSYSKTIGVGDTSGFQDPNNIQAERAATSTSQKQHFVVSGVYQLPFGRGQTFGTGWNRWVDGALGGWSFSPILTLNSGLPLNLTESKNPSNSGGTADRPNVVGNPNQSGTIAANSSCSAPVGPTHTRTQWFNPCAFQVQPAGTYGNAGRNLIIGPGSVNLDASIHKSVAFSERVSAQLRLEAFNVANHPNLASPALNIQGTSFGVISGASGNARQVQAAIKVLF
jgi:hypothetical protein